MDYDWGYPYVEVHFAHRRLVKNRTQQERAAYEKVQHHQDGNRIAKVLKFKAHGGLLAGVDSPLLPANGFAAMSMLKQQTSGSIIRKRMLALDTLGIMAG